MKEKASEAVEVFSGAVLRKVVPVTILGVLVYGAMLVYGDASAMSRLIKQAPGWLLLASLGLALASFAVRGARWLYYLKVSGLEVPRIDALLVCVAGFAMSITPAKMGEVLKALLLKQAYDIPVARGAPLVVAERVTDLVGLLLLGGFGLLSVSRAETSVLFGMSAAVGLVALVGNKRFGLLVLALLARTPILHKLHEKFLTAYMALIVVLRPLPLFVGVTLSVLSWGLQCLCVSVLVLAFHSEGITLDVACVTYSAPLLVGTLVLLPGGLGLTEASMAGALQQLAGLSPDVAIITTLLVRLVTFWFAIVLGFASLAVWRRRHPPGQCR